jgi:hypothetical protein
MSDDDHLNSNRIRQMAALRRAAIRTRSYCFIALCLCVAAMAEFTFEAVREWPTPFSLRRIWLPILYIACVILIGVIGLPALGRLFVRNHREAKQSVIAPPTTPPDFSQLQDGSQIARNLEEM